MRRKSAKDGQRHIWAWWMLFAMFAPGIFIASPAWAQAPQNSGEEIVILAFGDSLTAGYLLPPDKSFPAQLQAALTAKGYKARVINSGVSGDTAADGLARLDWSLGEKADAAIVEFGGNDALRGGEPKALEKSLDRILGAFQAKGIELLLAGMEAPRNWGKDYDDAFRAVYPPLAAKYNAVFYPFFLTGVAANPSLNLADGLHPTPEGAGVIVRNIMPKVEELIARVKEKRAAAKSG